MKCFLLLLTGLSIGFFDSYVLFSFMLLFVLLTMLDFGSFWFGGVFFVDSLSFFLIYLTGLVLLFCVFSSLSDFWFSNLHAGFILTLTCIFILLFVSFVSLSIFLFYVCFEAIFMIMFFFVMVWGYSPERMQASYYMVFYTLVVSFPFLIFIVLSGELGGNTLKFCLNIHFSQYWWFFLLLVFLVKLPVFGVHLWLPKAHVEAPVSGSMVLAGVLLKLGGYGFLRFSFFISSSLVKHSGLLFSIGLSGGLVSCFLCLRQSDLKSFVAYSSICHMGFGLAGVYSYSYYGMLGGVYMMIGHGFCSSCLFYILFVLYKRFHTRSLFILKGVGYLMPSIVLSWFVFSIINMGVPPSFSFFSEILILTGMSSLSLFSCLLSGIFLFLAGVYGIFLYTVSSHGSNFMESLTTPVFTREYLIFYGHLFPLIFVPYFVNFFFV